MGERKAGEGPFDHDAAQEAALRSAAKQALRQRMRSVRRVMPESACAERSAAICERLQALAAFAQARCIVGYAAKRKEADPALALAAAALQGKRTGLVRIAQAITLSLHDHRAGDPLVENGYGIAEPLAEAPRIDPSEVDVIVVPALALDGRGHRIGYGEGYYDRLLATLPPRTFKVGVIYDFQLLMEVPNAAFDVPLDCVVTDRQVLLPAR